VRIPGLRIDLAELGRRLSIDLLLYRGGVLDDVSAPVLRELGLVGPLLPAGVYTEIAFRDRIEVSDNTLIGGQETRVGYRVIDRDVPATPVLAAPLLVDVGDLQRERENLALGVLLVTILGVAGAVAMASYAARSLSKPVQSLRTAAIAVGRGDPLPTFGPDVPTEFVPVVDAFVRMAHDIERSQAALEAARRRTATVLANVATGVVAVDRELRVTIANPRAAELLGSSLPAGDTILDVSGPEWRPVWDWMVEFMETGTEFDEREFALGDRQIRAQVAAMHSDPPGCVVALDDTTELSRAVRVLAWGELARQIAHEIKNPLTPIRLGIQHIQRARRDGSTDFDATLERTGRHILAEIERLDAIARAFARFGAPPAETAPLELSDVAAIANETAALYAVGDVPEIRVEAEPNIEARVRRDEVKEVLINLVENARDAHARLVVIAVERNSDAQVTIRVRDDGWGITKEHMTRVFEPQFSTASSGTGLGLAICRRLVEGWGGRVSVKSEGGEGTEVTIVLETAEAAPGDGLQ
jgi:nitrogen fixation/metabolism regulation signal transduction histidine kinase